MPRAGADEHAQHTAAGPAAAKFHVFNDAADALQLVFLQLRHLAEVGHVLVGPREEEEHVAGGLQVEPLERFRPLRTYAFKELDGRGELFGRGFFRNGHSRILARPTVKYSRRRHDSRPRPWHEGPVRKGRVAGVELAALQHLRQVMSAGFHPAAMPAISPGSRSAPAVAGPTSVTGLGGVAVRLL